ncbi:NUDIX hydrolase domain-containing protein [Rhizobium etli 8C-3]|uniref:8-oxo-dGTP diphosphatase n=2 Tax=Rhizobium TaxID=379 RepID=A0A4R3QDF0_9HYPH|nr:MULTISPECIES: NUDIX domain-containing protein [Rhizobium]APO74948.1 NUDIX hydrolase domain-containing protein [Rhizobium etli 8C-3]TCU17602.1 8-oxo-dGTP diphosphatase [Rhizobium azibense]TCU31685.1 8-oxo-dGTP diphosphatase [Rhizobium azibense]
MGKPGIHFPGLGVGLVILRDGKILLYKRILAPEAGHWSIVGGKVDHMEPIAEAARREAEEETGLTIARAELLGHAEVISGADAQHWVSFLYIATEVSGDPQLTEPEKLSDFGWFTRSELPTPLSDFAKAAIDYLDNEDFR